MRKAPLRRSLRASLAAPILAHTSESISASPWMMDPRCLYLATATTSICFSVSLMSPLCAMTSSRWWAVAPVPLYTAIISVLPLEKLMVMWASSKRCRTKATTRSMRARNSALSTPSKASATSSCQATRGKVSGCSENKEETIPWCTKSPWSWVHYNPYITG